MQPGGSYGHELCGEEGGKPLPEASTRSPRWRWARLLKRVFDLAMATCPLYHQGALRLIAALTPGEVIRKILRPLQLAADPPPMAPARCGQEAFAWSCA